MRKSLVVMIAVAVALLLSSVAMGWSLGTILAAPATNSTISLELMTIWI